MPYKTSIRRVIHTSIITAFSLAAALIWKDVIMDAIKYVVPPGEMLFYKFLAALIATGIVILAIYIILKTEQEASSFLGWFRRRRR